MPHRPPVPVIEPMLQPGETVLLLVDAAATTVLDGPGGFLQFRQWEAVQPEPVGHTILPGLVWRVVDEFVLGSMGREPLRELLNRLAVSEMYVVPQGLLGTDVGRPSARDYFASVPSGATETATLIAQAMLLGTAFGEQVRRDWYGVIMAEAATTFSDGGTVIQQVEMVSLSEAKVWLVGKLAELLAAEEQVSQAVVLGPDGGGYELMPSTWPVPGFERGLGRFEWVAIEVEEKGE